MGTDRAIEVPMSPIDLLDYTDRKHKIPSVALNHTPKKAEDFKSWKILSAFGIDFIIAGSVQIMVTSVLQMSFDSYMSSGLLQRSFFALSFHNFGMGLTPLFFMGYYFFSYFFNHGQTYGQIKMKARVQIPQLSLRSSFFWAIFSTLIMFTCGLSYPFTYKWMQGMGLGRFVSEDYLYQELIAAKEQISTNLLGMTQTFEQQAKVKQDDQEDLYTRAA